MRWKVLFYLVSLCSGLTSVAQDTTRVSVLFLGDIMQHDSQLQAALLDSGGYDYLPCFQYVRKYFEAADLVIGNLELTLAGPPYKGYPQFSAPDELAVALKTVGLDVLVTANNHSMDRGRAGLERTLNVLDSLSILHTGTFRDTVERLNEYPLMVERNGISVALLNYTYGTNGIAVRKPNIVNMIDTVIIEKDIARAKSLLADAVIVMLHWGNEYQQVPSAFQKAVAAFCLSRGVTAVIGSHPHVVQPMELKESNQLVVYSLGNFVSGQRDRYKDGGAMAGLHLQKIYLASGATVTQLDSVFYDLVWVYRTADAYRDYMVLPVKDFEGDTTGRIADEKSQLAFATFVKDSRDFFNRKNMGVSERRVTPPDTTYYYSIIWDAPSDSSDHSLLKAECPGITSVPQTNGTFRFVSGTCRSREEAEKYFFRIRQRFPKATLNRHRKGK
jgi:poly-gamma-glutamate synthesis protein (capsule biosynthesis protein)